MIEDNKARAALIQASVDFLTATTTISTSDGSYTGLPTIPIGNIAWENRNFDTVGKDIWASVFYRPNAPAARTIGPGGFDELNGFLQIDFNTQKDIGEELMLKWREKSRLFFHGGRYFSHSGHSVIVIASDLGQSRHVENNFRQSLTVAFKSHIKRPQLT